jgi:hypothetical protein
MVGLLPQHIALPGVLAAAGRNELWGSSGPRPSHT